MDEQKIVKGYKAFNPDMTCQGFQYEIGKEYIHDGELILCESGFHFCKGLPTCYNYYPKNLDTIICEVEALGDVIEEIEHDGKCVTNHIRIGNKVDRPYMLTNVDKSSIGFFNSGKRNTGNHNSGPYNTGNHNSGSYNTGDHNSGHCNSGYNNAGNNNFGRFNSGNWNAGNGNSGTRNIGNYNTGDINIGNYSTGCFCTEEHPTIKFFDKESDWTLKDWQVSYARFLLSTMPTDYTGFERSYNMTDKEKSEHPEHEIIGGYLKEIRIGKTERQEWWDSLYPPFKQVFYDLPNFDAEKFCKCIGIDHI